MSINPLPVLPAELAVPAAWKTQAHDIERALELAEEVGPNPHDQRWQINDDSAAEWALRKRAQALAAIGDARRLAEAWQQQITDWLEAQLAGPERDAAFFEALLLDYQRRRREEDGTATVKLPTGTLRSRSAKPKVEVTDEAALLDWLAETLPAEDYERVVRTTEKVLVSELRDVVGIYEDVVGWRLRLARGLDDDPAATFALVLTHLPEGWDEDPPQPGTVLDLEDVAGMADPDLSDPNLDLDDVAGAVVVVEAEPVVRRRALQEGTGTLVPGCTVTAPAVTYSISQ